MLASIIWVALYGMFTQMADVWRYFKLSIADMVRNKSLGGRAIEVLLCIECCVFFFQLIWLVVFVATVLLGVDLGLGVGVGFSLFIIVFRTIL